MENRQGDPYSRHTYDGATLRNIFSLSCLLGECSGQRYLVPFHFESKESSALLFRFKIGLSFDVGWLKKRQILCLVKSSLGYSKLRLKVCRHSWSCRSSLIPTDYFELLKTCGRLKNDGGRKLGRIYWDVLGSH